MTYETVLWETPARRATSLLVNFATLLLCSSIRIVDTHQSAILTELESRVKGHESLLVLACVSEARAVTSRIDAYRRYVSIVKRISGDEHARDHGRQGDRRSAGCGDRSPARSRDAARRAVWSQQRSRAHL